MKKEEGGGNQGEMILKNSSGSFSHNYITPLKTRHGAYFPLVSQLTLASSNWRSHVQADLSENINLIVTAPFDPAGVNCSTHS